MNKPKILFRCLNGRITKLTYIGEHPTIYGQSIWAMDLVGNVIRTDEVVEVVNNAELSDKYKFFENLIEAKKQAIAWHEIQLNKLKTDLKNFQNEQS